MGERKKTKDALIIAVEIKKEKAPFDTGSSQRKIRNIRFYFKRATKQRRGKQIAPLAIEVRSH